MSAELFRSTVGELLDKIDQLKTNAVVLNLDPQQERVVAAALAEARSSLSKVRGLLPAPPAESPHVGELPAEK